MDTAKDQQHPTTVAHLVTALSGACKDFKEKVAWPSSRGKPERPCSLYCELHSGS